MTTLLPLQPYALPHVRALQLCVVVWAVLPAGRALAQLAATTSPVLVLDDGFYRTSLGPLTRVFIDPSGKLDHREVGKLPRSRFARVSSEIPSFGLSRSVFWFRFDVDNRYETEHEWLLETGTPTLDLLDLYAPRPDGTIKHSASGDLRAFHTRDVPYHSVVFRVHSPPGVHTYLLRVQSSSSVTVPMVAFSSRAFLDELSTAMPIIWAFYGWMLVMGLYNLFLFFAIRDIAYLHYVSYLISFTLFQGAWNGLAYQYLWPESPGWNNRCIGVFVGLSCATGAQFLRTFINTRDCAPKFHRSVGILGWGGGAATIVVALLASDSVRVRFTIALCVPFIGFVLYIALVQAWRGNRQARYYLGAWATFLLGVGLFLVTTLSLLRATLVTEWIVQIGAAAEAALLSLGLADRINVMRRNLAGLNLKLQQNVEHLTVALERADQARKAKTAFLASVSHELRTPLNAIINIPEGILEWFRRVECAECSECHAKFQLDDGEHLEEDTSCPECGRPELQLQESRVFEGDALVAATELEHVHRAATHLLDVVTDILDVSKLEVGRMQLAFETIDLNTLLCDVLDTMKPLARQKGVLLEWQVLRDPSWVHADRIRLKQIVINLVSNAIKFSDGRGSVKVLLIDGPDAYRVGVHDRGIGIREQDHQRIFEGFDQGSMGEVRRFGGTGLGLSITRQLVQLHHGDIWLDSVLGQGSNFYFSLPKASHQSALDSKTGGYREKIA